MTKENLEKIWTKNFISISITQFLVFIAFYTLLTTLPIYVIDNLGESKTNSGLVVTVMLIAAILIRPFSAKILDHFGKKKGLIFSVTIFTITCFFYIWIKDFIPLLVLRFFHGLSFGIITTATGAIAADIIPATRRGTGLGYFAMAMNLAVVAGPFIGLLLLQFVTFQTLFIILSLFMIFAILSSILVQVPEHASASKPSSSFKLKLADLIEMKAVPISLISSLAGLAYASILSFISIYADSLNLISAASYFFLVFAIIMLLSRPSLGRVFDTRGPKYVILPCLLIFAIGLVMLSFTSTAWMLLVTAGLIGLGYGSLLPGFQTMAIQTAHTTRSSHATATFFIFYDSGIAAGAFLWGIIANGLGFENMYLICAALVLVTLFLFYLYETRSAANKKGLLKRPGA